VSWIPLVAWLAAVVITALVLGFCAYEISWKARRLRADVEILQRVVGGGIAQLQGDAATARARLARAVVR